MSSPSTHRTNTDLHTPLRAQIKTLHFDAGLSKKAISKKLAVPRFIVRDAIYYFKRTSRFCNYTSTAERVECQTSTPSSRP